jgi:hypothetical protein
MLINEEESKETTKVGQKEIPKWSLLEVTLRDRNLIWCLGQLNSGNSFARVFRIKTLNIDAHLSDNGKEPNQIDVETEHPNFLYYPYVSIRSDGKSVFIGG